MASYTYLTVSDSPAFSGEEQNAHPDAAPFFEGKYGIPLFWLCLFDARHLKVKIAINDQDGEKTEREYPWLVALREEALELGRKRRALLVEILSEEQLALFDAFLVRVEKEFSPYLQVITDDVADMDGPDEYAVHIREAMKTMTSQPVRAWLSNFSFENVTSLGYPVENESAYALVGHDNTSRWPEEPPATDGGKTPPEEESPLPPTGKNPAKSANGEKEGKARRQEVEFEQLADSLIPPRYAMDMDDVRAQELLYTIQVALAVQKTNAMASSPKGLEAARKFLAQVSKRSHISHGSGSKFLAFDRTKRAKIWGYINILVIILSLCSIGLAIWLHWLWILCLPAGLAYLLFFPDPTITAFEFSKGYIRHGFKRIPFSAVTLADFTLTGKDEHLWASLNLFNGPKHILVLSGRGRGKYMTAFFCALWRLMFPVK